MLLRVDQAIIVVHTYFYRNIVLKESIVQYSSKQGITPPFIGDVVIHLDMLMYILSLSSLFVRVSGA